MFQETYFNYSEIPTSLPFPSLLISPLPSSSPPMKMEAGKRKRAPTADGAARERKSARRDPPSPAVDDAEVDEFFAILRRMREASSKCRAPAAAPARANGAIRLSGEDGLTWKPAFVWEDFEGYAGASVSGDDDKAEDGNRRSLDLNADPEPEGR